MNALPPSLFHPAPGFPRRLVSCGGAGRWLLAALVGALAGCGETAPPVALNGPTMGTRWSLQIADPASEPERREIAAFIRRELQQVEKELSHWQPDSALSRWNQSPGTDWQPVPAALAETVALARRISLETDGALEVTVAPLVALWGFSGPHPPAQVPTEAEIQKALSLVGPDKVEVRTQPPALKKLLPGVQVNVAAVTEGYVLEALSARLQARGLKNFLLEIGGEVLARGHAADGHPWRVGVQAPDGEKGESLESLPLENASIATSGSYRHRYERDGQIYSHILDPRSGRPVRHRLVSVSVIHASCALADGYATALMVLGPEKGREVARRLGLRVVWLQEP